MGRGGGGSFGTTDRPIRTQLVGALLLGLVLVVTGLYLWRRPPRGDLGSAAAESSSSSASAPDEAGVRAVVADAAPPLITVSEVRMVGCHDRGPKVTPPEVCDHLPPIEQALSHAVEQSLPCVPSTDAGGTIEYLADVSFSRHKLRIILPRSGRSVQDRKVVTSCATAVRDAMHSVTLDGLDHQHARYQLAITATYRGRS
ncbi:MAG TPA: hypothetical protein VEK07_12060 [Polyangiaceae bacterium]|nr:hypothetical protein [Polyangiaceae bacterium]